MRVDATRSVFHESASARVEFDRTEIRRCRYLLRRLRFLETKVRETGGMAEDDPTGGAPHAEWEMEALEWVLTEVGFLDENRVTRELQREGAPR